MSFINIFIVRAGTQQELKVPDDQVLVKSITSKKLELKVLFNNPALISMSAQSELDNLVIKFSKDLILNDIYGNSLVLDEGASREGSIEVPIPIQPQVSESSEV